MSRATLLVGAVVLLLAAIGGGVALGLGHGARSHQAATMSAASAGWQFDRQVPRLPLLDARGRPMSLSALRGRVVVLAPSLTLCAEVCPMTTGAFASMRATMAANGLASRVAFVEVTVDPWRDSPARLRAYARLTGVRFAQLTGSVNEIQRFWRFFGIGFRRVAEGHPPDIDWWTHRPERFDVEHADGVFVIDASGRERTFFPGPANMRGRLAPQLRALLSDEGRRNLAHPVDAWTPGQVLEAVSRLLHRPIRASA